MEITQTVDKSSEDEINYESFLDAERTAQTEQQTGVAQLTELMDVNSETREKFVETLDFEGDELKFFKAEKDLSDEEIYLVISKDQWNIIEEWTGRSSISELAGQYVPIQKLEDDIYTIHDFSDLRFRFDISVEEIKHLYDTNSIKFEDGRWVMTDLWQDYDDFMKNVLNVTSFVGFIFAALSVFFLAVTQLTVVYLLFVMGWMVTLGIQMYLSQRRKKPIEPVIENI